MRDSASFHILPQAKYFTGKHKNSGFSAALLHSKQIIDPDNIISYHIVPNGGMEQLCELCRGLALRERPHDLCHDCLGRHIVCLGKLVFLLDAEFDLINAHITSLVRNLRGDHDADASPDQLFDLLDKLVVIVIGQAATSLLKHPEISDIMYVKARCIACPIQNSVHNLWILPAQAFVLY